MATAAVVLAGGEGVRMGAQVNKAFLDVDGRTIVDHSLGIFESSRLVEEIVLVTRWRPGCVRTTASAISQITGDRVRR